MASSYKLHKVLKVSTWIIRFINNCSKIKERGPLTTSEIQCQDNFYIKQKKVERSEKFEESRKRLNLQLNCEGIYKYRSKIQGAYQVYLPLSSALSEKIFMSVHRKTLHGGAASTIATITSLY